MTVNFQKISKKINLTPQKRWQKIFLWVLGGHIFVVFSPLVVTYMGFLFKAKEKKIDTIKVVMVSPSSPKTAYQDPVLKPVPEQPRIKEQSKIKPKAKPKEKPKKVEEKKPKVKVQDKNKVNPPKKKPAPPKKTVKNDDISDLKVVRQIENPPARTPNNSSNNTSKTTDNNRTQIAPEIQGEKSDEYISRISGVIFEMWNAPNNELVNGRNLQALIRIKIDNMGRIIECKMLKKSGFPAFDWTVYELLKKLQRSRIPLPPDNRREFEFALQPE
ncbi:MAG: TonB C-terminal domain-containing protein [Lentisphaeria bacterium]|nr:TonB C-terminal domain-containing protein [Lentisphaeria bacterium]